MPPSRVRIPPSPLRSTERCPSGLRSATGNRVRAERCVAGSNPALSALLSLTRPRPQAREGDLVVDRLSETRRRRPTTSGRGTASWMSGGAPQPRGSPRTSDPASFLPARGTQGPRSRRSRGASGTSPPRLSSRSRSADPCIRRCEGDVHDVTLAHSKFRIRSRRGDAGQRLGLRASSPSRSSTRTRTRTSPAARGTRSRCGTTSPRSSGASSGRACSSTSARSRPRRPCSGPDVSLPILIAPLALQRMAHPDGELATARAAAAAGTIMCLSTAATVRPAEVAAAAPGAPHWFQVYVFADRRRPRS